MNIEVPTKYQLSHDDRIIVFENRLHTEIPMLFRPALHGNWNAFSLAEGQIPRANGSTHSCVTKSSGVPAGPCIRILTL